MRQTSKRSARIRPETRAAPIYGDHTQLAALLARPRTTKVYNRTSNPR